MNLDDVVAAIALMAESRDITFDAVRCKETMAALEVTSGSPLLHCSRTTFCRLLEAAGTSPNAAIVLYTAWRRRVDDDRTTNPMATLPSSEFMTDRMEAERQVTFCLIFETVPCSLLCFECFENVIFLKMHGVASDDVHFL